MRLFWRVLPVFITTLALCLQAGAQNEISIDHATFNCIPPDQFPVVRATIESPNEIQNVRVFFRSDKHLDFYYVEMILKEGLFEAVLPMPAPETGRIIYYVEIVDVDFNGTRTEEYDPEITEQCDTDPSAVYPGGDPGIVLGALKAGAAALPPGFQAAGIAGLVAATGGGAGAATVVAIAAGGAGAAGAAVLVGNSDGSTTSTAPPLGAVTTTVPAGGSATTSIGVGTTTTISGSSTTTTATTTASPSTTTSVDTTTTTTTSAPSLRACFETNHLNHCLLKFDARCSSGDIVNKLWEIDTGGVAGGPFVQNTPADVYNHNFGTCSGQIITVRLTVTASDGRTDTDIQPVGLPSALRTLNETEGSPVSFVSQMDLSASDRMIQGTIVSNHAHSIATDSSGPHRYTLPGKPGKMTIEAFAGSGRREEVFWRFDFSGARSFVAGSLAVEEGQVVFRDGHVVVFRFSGSDGTRVRFSLQLAEN